jgi:uncharacterized membrane protein
VVTLIGSLTVRKRRATTSRMSFEFRPLLARLISSTRWTDVKTDKIELLTKVIAWRFFSMCYGFSIAYVFTKNAGESAGIVFLTGSSLTFLQWGFEIIWDRRIRSKLRNALSRQHGRIGRLVRFGRGARAVGVDEHKPGSHGGEAWTDPRAPENAGREWT